MSEIDWEHDNQQQRIAKRQRATWAYFEEAVRNELLIRGLAMPTGESEEAIVRLWRSNGWTLVDMKRYVLALGMLPKGG